MTKLGTVVGSTDGTSYNTEVNEYEFVARSVGLKEGFHAPSKNIE